MSASVNIQTRRVNNVLAIPINAVTTRDSSAAPKGKDAKDQKPGTEGNEEAPAAAAKETGINEVVFVLQKDGTVKLQAVKTGIQDDTNIEILSGLKEGDEVISAPYSAVSKALENGKKVKVVPKEQLFEGPKK
jgi:HlyD family secretion protein